MVQNNGIFRVVSHRIGAASLDEIVSWCGTITIREFGEGTDDCLIWHVIVHDPETRSLRAIVRGDLIAEISLVGDEG